MGCSFFLFITVHAFDRRTDGRTDIWLIKTCILGPFLSLRLELIVKYVASITTVGLHGKWERREEWETNVSFALLIFFCATADISSAYIGHLFLIICDRNRCYRTARAIVIQSLLPSSGQTTCHRHAYMCRVDISWRLFGLLLQRVRIARNADRYNSQSDSPRPSVCPSHSSVLFRWIKMRSCGVRQTGERRAAAVLFPVLKDT